MFNDCYLRLGKVPFASCTPLTVQLLASLYALPERSDTSLRTALEAMADGQPWSESLVVAPEQTCSAVTAMLRQVMLATRDLEPTSIDSGALPEGSRSRAHLEALLGLWRTHPEVTPSDLLKLKDFLNCVAGDALQPISVIRDPANRHTSLLERTVLDHLEAHHGVVRSDDRDYQRLIATRKDPAAPSDGLLGHIQRHLLDPSTTAHPLDDSLAVLSVRDSLTECETATAIIQHSLSQDATLQPSDIAVLMPASGDYAFYLAATFARAGLTISSMPSPASRRNIGAEAVLHFLQCRRRPAPAMALASLYCSPVLCWAPEIGNILAGSVIEGDYKPHEARNLTGKAASLFELIRSPSPSSNKQLKEQLRRFQQLLSDDEALRPDVLEAKSQIMRVISALGSAPGDAEPDWEKLIQFSAAYQASQPERGAHYPGGITVLLTHEAPKRVFRKLLLLGFNDGNYPAAPSGNPFFLDSEVTQIRETLGLDLPSQASQLDEALSLFVRQISAASEQVVLLLSERDRTGSLQAPSSSLPLIARMVADCESPEELIRPLSRSAGTIWDRLIAWQPRPDFKLAEAPEVPECYNLDINLLGLRHKEDGSLRAQSPSRLEKLLVSPLAWLLSELDATHVSWQPEQFDVMLRGSLAHEVFERLFLPGLDHPDDAKIEALVPDLLLDRIRAIAPFLQNATWIVERTALEAEIIRSAKHWSMVLKSLGGEIVGNEFWLAGELFGHPVHGKADCLLQLPGGQPVVVDYKKSSAGGRRLRLQKGWDLQVDLYRRMHVNITEHSEENVVRISDILAAWEKPPAVGYHTLNDGNVLINGADNYQNDHVEIIPGEIAKNALELIKARFDALKSGRLDTNTTADEKHFRTSAALGTYALSESPLITAFMRQNATPSISLSDETND